MNRNGDCEIFRLLFLNHLVCWIWTAFCYAFQRLSSISACLSSFFDLSIFLSLPHFGCLLSQQDSWSCLKTRNAAEAQVLHWRWDTNFGKEPSFMWRKN